MKYKMSDVVKEISERENNPSTSDYKRFVGLEHYVTGEVRIRKYGSTEPLDSAMKIFHSGDILVARRNVYLRRASAVDFDGLTSGDSIVLRPTNKVIGRLLPFILNTDLFWDFADQHADGTMSKRLSPKTLLSYEFDLPDEKECMNLADLLWAAADAKEKYQNLKEHTDELLKSRFAEMFGNLDENTKKWQVKSFNDFAIIDTNMTTDYEKYADYPHIGIDSIEKNTGRLSGYRTVKEDNVISGKYVFSPEQIIYSKIRPALNKVALPDFEGVCSADAYPLLPIEGVCNREYLAHVLRSEYFLKFIFAFSSRSQMPKVNKKQISGFSMPLPPLELQEQFAEFMQQCECSKDELDRAIEAVDVLIKSLIQQNFREE